MLTVVARWDAYRCRLAGVSRMASHVPRVPGAVVRRDRPDTDGAMGGSGSPGNGRAPRLAYFAADGEKRELAGRGGDGWGLSHVTRPPSLRFLLMRRLSM